AAPGAGTSRPARARTDPRGRRGAMTHPPAVTFPAHELERRRAHLLDEVRRGRRRRLVPLAALAAVLVALAAALPGQLAPTRMTLVDQALAAFGRGSTIHVVLET